MTKLSRPTWDEYFLSITKLVTTRSTCIRKQCGAVLVKDKHIISTGYNGAAKGLNHCLNLGCMKDEYAAPERAGYAFCRAIHAETNAFLQAARYGIPVEGSTLYITRLPCQDCAKQIVNVGVSKVVFLGQDFEDAVFSMFEAAQVELLRMKE